MKTAKQLFIILIGAYFLAGCKKNYTDASPSYMPQLPAYYNLFNNTSGWIGSDAAYSIPISSQKILWLFGDTWNGTIANNKRVNADITANNTIGIQDGYDPATATMTYYFGNAKASFFAPDDNVGFLWPLHGTMIGSELYIFFVQVEISGSGQFNFNFINSKLIKVSNPLDPPSQWRISQYLIPHSFLSATEQIVYGTSVIQKDGYIYIFGTDTDNSAGDRYLLLARAGQDSITDFSSWRFYSRGQWVSNYQAADRLTDRVGFELSVSFQPQKNKFVLITTQDGLSPNINMQYADSLWGAWTAPFTVYQCPETNWGPGISNYAAKGHPELSANNELIISYASNSSNLDDVINNSQLYWPRFIRITF